MPTSVVPAAQLAQRQKPGWCEGPDLGRDAGGQGLGVMTQFTAALFTADTTARSDAVVIDGAIPTPHTVRPPISAST